MRSIIYILLLLSLFFGICIFAGIKWALLALSTLMITLAAVFIIKKDSYVKYIEFVNPKYALLYATKSDDFKRKHRIIDIIVFYIIAAIMLFIAVIVPNIILPIQGSIFVYLMAATILLTVLLWCISLFILKRSNKNSNFWFYFIASISAAVIVLAIIQNLIS